MAALGFVITKEGMIENFGDSDSPDYKIANNHFMSLRMKLDSLFGAHAKKIKGYRDSASQVPDKLARGTAESGYPVFLYTRYVDMVSGSMNCSGLLYMPSNIIMDQYQALEQVKVYIERLSSLEISTPFSDKIKTIEELLAIYQNENRVMVENNKQSTHKK